MSTALGMTAQNVVHRPSVAILDESTSAVTTDLEEKLYETLTRSIRTVVSVGHRPGLRRLHEWVLQLDGDGAGEWQLSQS